jgi:lipopolysaccharide export system protein LptA
LEQNNATVKSDNIQYYINEQLVKANGGDGRQSGRVEVVIPPRHKGEAP